MISCEGARCTTLVPNRGHIAAGVGGDLHYVPALVFLDNSQVFTKVLVCLGEQAFGGLKTFDLELQAGFGKCPSALNFILGENVAIEEVSDAICPMRGEVLNGDFQGGVTGWR